LPARKSKADIVLVAARYEDDGQLKMAKGCVRHDQIWSDVKLFDRETLVDMLGFDRRVATAKSKDLATDFSLISRVHLKEVDGHMWLVVNGNTASRDDLGLPLF
jgi:uncharacterized radical SAM superfamily Fe-S cluster-containing enzyme